MRRKAHELPTADRVRELLEYDAQTGFLTWRVRPATTPNERLWNIRYAGKQAGCVANTGYVLVRIDGRLCAAHRIAWAWMTSAWPEDDLDVDHANGNPSDNTFSNLRLASRAENIANSKVSINNRLGKKGVYRVCSGRYGAGIRVNGRAHYLGYFDTPEEASAAYVAAAEKYFGRFARAA
jgi:hypothetical protein